MIQPLRAAFGKVKITPEETAPLQGYNPELHVADPGSDILEDLHARIVLLDDGSTRNLIISTDSCFTNEVPFLAADPDGTMRVYRHFKNTFPEGTKRMWGEAAGIEEDAVSVHATHTHSAPEHFTQKYTSRIAAKIQQMVNELQPVKLRYGTGACSISANRRPTLNPNYSLPVDRSMHVLRFETEQGQPVGCLVNCAVHPTLVRNPANRVSSEFVGLAMAQLEQQYGGSFTSIFLQGFSGDVCPARYDRADTDDTYPKVKQTAQELYSNISTTLHQAAVELSSPLLLHEVRTASLPTREGYLSPTIAVTISGIRLGELALISVSGEIFNGYIAKLQTKSPFRYTLFSGVANGYCGYLPTTEAFQDGLGGYEMNTTPYSIQACAIFIEEAELLMQSLLNRKAQT